MPFGHISRVSRCIVDRWLYHNLDIKGGIVDMLIRSQTILAKVHHFKKHMTE